MFSYLNSATEWLQRKALHYVLKAKLGEFFEDDFDLEQLQVQFKQHEQHGDLTWRGVLSDVRINTRTLSKHLDIPGWCVTRGSVSRVELTLRIAALSCAVHLQGLTVHVAPSAAAPAPDSPPAGRASGTDGAQAPPVAAPPSAASVPSTLESEGSMFASAAFEDHIMGIAAALEKLLNTLSLRVDDVCAHIHLAPPPPPSAEDSDNSENPDGPAPAGVPPSPPQPAAIDTVVVCRLASVKFFDSTCDVAADDARAPVMTRHKTVSVTGLVIKLELPETAAPGTVSVAGHATAAPPRKSSVLVTGPGGQGYSATANLVVKWSGLPAAPRLSSVSVAISSRSCLCVPLQPCHLVALERLIQLSTPPARNAPAADAPPPAPRPRLNDSFLDGLVRPAAVWKELATASASAAAEPSALPAEPEGAALAESFYNASSQLIQSMLQGSVMASETSGADAPPADGPLTWSLSVELGIQPGRPGAKADGKAFSVSMWSADLLGGPCSGGASTSKANGVASSARHGASASDPWCISLEATLVKLTAHNSGKLSASCSAVGVQLVEQLPAAMSAHQGGVPAIDVAGLIPALVQMAPKSPAFDACASLHLSEASTGAHPFRVTTALCPLSAAVPARASRLNGSHAGGLEGYAAWPVFVSLDGPEDASLGFQASYEQAARSWPAPAVDAFSVSLRPFAILLTIPLLKRTLSLLETCSAALKRDSDGPAQGAHTRAPPGKAAPSSKPGASAPPLDHSIEWHSWPGGYVSDHWSLHAMSNSSMLANKWTTATVTVTCPRVCVIGMDSSSISGGGGASKALDGRATQQRQQQQHTPLPSPTIVVVDVRSLPPTAGSGGRRSPMVQALRTASSRVGDSTLKKASSVQVALASVNAYMVELKRGGSDSLHATCLACMQPRDDEDPTAPPLAAADGQSGMASLAPRCALWLDVELSDEARAAGDSVMGDAVGMAWAQAERHTRRDWQTSAASHRGAAQPPPGGPGPPDERPYGANADDADEHVDAGWLDAHFDELLVKEA